MVILSMVRQHRLGPLLHWRLAREKAEVPVPEDVREALAASFKKGTLRALLLQRELLSISRTLDDARIPCVALKGAYLAFAVYPHPALRPLRDLDVLVPKESALSAYQALIDNGYSRVRDHPGDPEAGAAVAKHLPLLRSASGQVDVEVHVRLVNPDAVRAANVDESGLWERLTERKVAGHSIAYLSPTDLLLHLIVHAVYDHRFMTGPLALTDLSYLVRGAEVDWPLFWRLADERGWVRGCLLSLKMAQDYFGDLPIAAPDPAVAELEGVDTLAAACPSLTLGDLESRADMYLAGALAGKPLHRQVLILLGKAFPPRATIAATCPGTDGPLGIYAGYWARETKLLTRRVPEFLVNRKNNAVRSDAQKLADLDRWLVQE
jgi:hypothetical protein